MLKKTCVCGVAMEIVSTAMDVAGWGSEPDRVPVQVWACPTCKQEESISLDVEAMLEHRAMLPGFDRDSKDPLPRSTER